MSETIDASKLNFDVTIQWLDGGKRLCLVQALRKDWGYLAIGLWRALLCTLILIKLYPLIWHPHPTEKKVLAFGLLAVLSFVFGLLNWWGVWGMWCRREILEITSEQVKITRTGRFGTRVQTMALSDSGW
jgi:hypothetical protein